MQCSRQMLSLVFLLVAMCVTQLSCKKDSTVKTGDVPLKIWAIRGLGEMPGGCNPEQNGIGMSCDNFPTSVPCQTNQNCFIGDQCPVVNCSNNPINPGLQTQCVRRYNQCRYMNIGCRLTVDEIRAIVQDLVNDQAVFGGAKLVPPMAGSNIQVVEIEIPLGNSRLVNRSVFDQITTSAHYDKTALNIYFAGYVDSELTDTDGKGPFAFAMDPAFVSLLPPANRPKPCIVVNDNLHYPSDPFGFVGIGPSGLREIKTLQHEVAHYFLRRNGCAGYIQGTPCPEEHRPAAACHLLNASNGIPNCAFLHHPLRLDKLEQKEVKCRADKMPGPGGEAGFNIVQTTCDTGCSCL